MSEDAPAGAPPSAAPSPPPSAPAAELARLRQEVERVDTELVALIAERVRLARAIGAAKRAGGQPTLDPAREAEVVRRAGALARERGLPDERVRELFWQLIGLAREVQAASPPGLGIRDSALGGAAGPSAEQRWPGPDEPAGP